MTWRLPFQQLLHWGVGEGTTPFPGLLHFTLDIYLILLSVKQGGTKYHFQSHWYDANWDWTQVSWTIAKISCNSVLSNSSKQSSLAQVCSLALFNIYLALSIDRALSGATIPSQSGSGSNGNEGVLCIFQSPSITVTSPSDCLVSYPGHSLGWVLPICRGEVGVFYCPSRLGNIW